MKFGKFRYIHHSRLILAATGQYIWEISKKNAAKVATSIGKYFGHCRNFIVCILHIVSMYGHIQIVHIIWLIGIKSNGNYRNFIIFTCFICSIMCYVYSNTKTYTISPLVWLVGCKCQGNYRNFDNFPSIFHRLVKNCQTKCIKFNTHIWSTF